MEKQLLIYARVLATHLNKSCYYVVVMDDHVPLLHCMYIRHPPKMIEFLESFCSTLHCMTIYSLKI